MEGRRRVLSTANGPLDARVLFVAEAPGRLGGDRTGVPLTSDQTGRNFDRLLAEAGLNREAVFVTNAVLCNPRSARGNNRPPTRREQQNCADHLAAVLELVRAQVVVTLGAIALRALTDLSLREAVARPVPWRGRVLFPLYHLGPRAQIHRPFAQQRADFRALRDTIAGLRWA
jgi:uracil-DNA glycosylase family 4